MKVMNTEITYKVSTHSSKFYAYQSKKENTGTITLYVSTIYRECKDLDQFVEMCIFYTLLERICLERGFQKIRMKNRCNPCKMEKYAIEMMGHIVKDLTKVFK